MATQQHIAHALAVAVTAGQINEKEIVERAARVLGRRWRWLRPLARRIEDEFANGTRPRQATIRQWLIADVGFRRALRQHPVDVVSEIHSEPEMSAATGSASKWQVPSITTLQELADWVALPLEELEWLADRRGQEPSAQPKYRRYRYRLLSKGSRRFRLIEIPIYRLKLLQRRLLSGLLNQIEPHDASHGFRKGRSIHTFTANHTGREVVMKIDLQDCFATIGFGRVSHLFRRAGYPERVADTLAAIATNTVPEEVWDSANGVHQFVPAQRLPSIYGRAHLPQGAPTSPAIANLCLYKLDLRLTGLASACGAIYSRYADDLAFSGDADFARCVNRVRHQIAAIIQDEGFHVNHHKTRVMRASTRQRIAGVVVNQHRNIERREYDRLKAILHNCVKHGVESQNRENHSEFYAHLTGRVAFVEAVNPHRGCRLRELFNQIES
jgi:retron-type reverse transcriptase